MKYNFDKEVNRLNTNSCKWNVKDNELPMWVADMDFEVLPEIKEALMKKVNQGVYGYADYDNRYFDAYKLWWKKRYNTNLKTDWMIFSNGVVASLSSIVRKLTTPGENVLIQCPVYNCFFTSIENNGRKILSNDLVYNKADNSYSIDFSDLENKLKNKQTTMMILCNPHNPVGHIFTRDELIKIGRMCKENHVQIVVDEIHCDFTFNGKTYVPYLSITELLDDAIVLLSPNKTFNIAGLHGSVAVVPNENLRHKVWRTLNTDEVGEPNYFVQDAQIAAYQYGDKWVDELVNYIGNNRQYFIDYLKNNLPNLKVVKSDATYLLWIDISYYSNNSDEFCDKLREETGLFINSGLHYGENGRNFVRINVATSLKNVKDGLERLNKFLNGK